MLPDCITVINFSRNCNNLQIWTQMAGVCGTGDEEVIANTVEGLELLFDSVFMLSFGTGKCVDVSGSDDDKVLGNISEGI
ncbi:unnamed protein product [Brugia pahangi]|uniref:Ovule protein n=1 Tax=Brugia pahangi TaxID=6280 RepID=A0A0N4T9H8_BRUPA|nr:unnamed protein product [Brugia pahangi]